MVASAPIAFLNTDTRVLSCVRVKILDSLPTGYSGEHLLIASEGEKIAISIDPSDCDQSVVQSATSWTVYLGSLKDKNAEAVVVAHMLVPGMTEYMWIARPPFPQEQQPQSHVSSTQPDYYLQIQTVSQDGRELLVGRSAPFAIVTNTETQQQQNPESSNIPSSRPPIPRDPTKHDLPHSLKKRDDISHKTKLGAQAVFSDPVADDAKEDVSSETAAKTDIAPKATKDIRLKASAKDLAPEAGAAKAVPMPEAENAAVVPTDKPKSPPSEEEDPDSEDTPKPHYPNIPKDNTVPDPATVPNVSGPNQKSPQDPVPYVPPESQK
ncbi:hypothetical protein BG000_003041 [Podila horticola]|nr:hypothetical protein BG000_003041 [Podila horticola]